MAAANLTISSYDVTGAVGSVPVKCYLCDENGRKVTGYYGTNQTTVLVREKVTATDSTLGTLTLALEPNANISPANSHYMVEVDDRRFLITKTSSTQTLYQALDQTPAAFDASSGTAAPKTAQYVTLATDATLTSERVLTAGTGITLTDGGAGSTLTIAASSSGTVDVVSNVATSTVLGRVTAGSGDSEELTATQVRTLINVENGATADQTAAEILAALVTVDGSGSGLDADTLDGHDTSYFLASGASAGGDLSGTYPNPSVVAASDTTAGKVELATTAETQTGTDTVRAVTPAGAAATFVAKALFDANTIIYATTDDTPVALTVGASTIVGRKASGDIVALTGAELLAILTGQAAADFSMNSHKITSVTDPGSAQDAATKNYVDTTIAAASPSGSALYLWANYR